MLIDQIYQNFPELSDLRMRRITVEKYRRKVNCELSYPDAPDMDKSVQRRVIDFVKQNLPQGYTGYVSFVNDAFSVASFQTYFLDLLREKYPVFSDIGNKRRSFRQKKHGIDRLFDGTASGFCKIYLLQH